MTSILKLIYESVEEASPRVDKVLCIAAVHFVQHTRGSSSCLGVYLLRAS